MKQVFVSIANNSTFRNLTLILSLTLIFYFISISGLERDVINPDGINWHTRSINFVNALLKEHYSDTYQAYHPGVTLMWLTGPVLFHLEDYYESIKEPLYSKRTFLEYDYAAKMAVVVASTVLFFISLVLIKKLLNFQAVVLFSALAIFEPFMVGERRLYHLDYLMTYLLFVSFLCFFVYFYKSLKIHYLILGCLFLVLSILTKSAAIIFLPFPLMMGYFSNEKLWKRLISLPVFVILICGFAFATFPPTWKTPQKSIPKYIEKIYAGLTEIGYEGRKELGFSGSQKNITLEETFSPKPWYFYLQVLAFKLSHAVWVLALASLIIILISTIKFISMSIKDVVITAKNTITKKLYIPERNKNQIVWLGIYSFLVVDVFFTAFTIANKKGDRYAIVLIPFMFLIIAQTLSTISKKLAVVVALLIILSLIPQYIQIYPYFYAYGNPLIGGVKEKYANVDDAPFGVGIKQVFDYIKEDRTNNTAFYTIAGPKSLKAIADGAKFTKTPNCTTDYYVAYALDDQPSQVCVFEKFSNIATVKVGNMDYWHIYKKNAQPNDKAAVLEAPEETDE